MSNWRITDVGSWFNLDHFIYFETENSNDYWSVYGYDINNNKHELWGTSDSLEKAEEWLENWIEGNE